MTCVTRNPLGILYSFAKLTTTTVYRVYVTNFFDSIKGPGSTQSSPSLIETIKTQATSYKVLTRDLNPIWHNPWVLTPLAPPGVTSL